MNRFAVYILKKPQWCPLGAPGEANEKEFFMQNPNGAPLGAPGKTDENYFFMQKEGL
jgi:hypothetical protein